MIAALNQIDMLVMLEDGRTLPITGLYASLDARHRLTSSSNLDDNMKVDTWEEAEVFVVGFPDEDRIHLIVEVDSLTAVQATN